MAATVLHACKHSYVDLVDCRQEQLQIYKNTYWLLSYDVH